MVVRKWTVLALKRAIMYLLLPSDFRQDGRKVITTCTLHKNLCWYPASNSPFIRFNFNLQCFLTDVDLWLWIYVVRNFDNPLKTPCKHRGIIPNGFMLLEIWIAEENGGRGKIILNINFFHFQNSPPKVGGGDYSSHHPIFVMLNQYFYGWQERKVITS